MSVKQKHISEEKLVDYVLGNLSRIEYFKVNTHIKHCPRCQLYVQSWQKSLNNTTKNHLITPSKQQVYNTFFHKQRLKRRRFIITLTSISLFVLMFILVATNNYHDSSTNFTKDDTATKNIDEQLTLTEQQLDDYTYFLQTNLPSPYDDQIYFHTKYNDYLLKEISQIKRLNQTKQAIITDEQICIIDWQTMEIICYKYLQHQGQQKIPFYKNQLNIFHH